MLSFGKLAKKIFGSSNDRRIKGFQARVDEINALEPELQSLNDDELRERTVLYRERLAKGETLDALLPEAFATVREAARRSLGQRHFDVQLIGGMVLHERGIAEMRTGEGKTLVATLPAYLNALTGRGVHVITVNDYLASRDAEWMGRVYRFLGLEVGCIVNGLTDDERLKAYAADVTYGTNNEFGFDYLRDNMKNSVKEMVQFGGRELEKAGHYFAIVDEVDSILIDEARTPLIISGPVEDRSDLYVSVNAVIKAMMVAENEGQAAEGETPHEPLYELEEKQKQVTFTEAGNEWLEVAFREADLLKGETLYDVENVSVVHHAQESLKAHAMFARDKDYIVRNGEVVIIDEFTGRMMPGRRYSNGLHQALEAKENAQIQPENQTLASITFQNYFRLYEKLAGMTGTASTEAAEFGDIYSLAVVEVPTNVPVSRIDEDDEVYRTQNEKYRAIVGLIADCRRRGQPILVGTTSIGKSEDLSAHLKDKAFIKEMAAQLLSVADGMKDGEDDDYRAYLRETSEYLTAQVKAHKSGDVIPHQVLNARYHEQEATIIADAGIPGAVTIATNMAGRGTDIQLGGNVDLRFNDWLRQEEAAGRDPSEDEVESKRNEMMDEVASLKQEALDAGGLCVVGTERHESRRIDNQLRGRSGRQGDPGRSRFFLSLEDDLMRIFGSDRMEGMLKRLGLRDGEAIVHPWINKALEKAQSKVEARNFDARKHVLKYDDVMNDQRKVIFEQRIELMGSEDVAETVSEMREEVVDGLVTKHIPPNAYAEQWDAKGLGEEVQRIFNLGLPVEDWAAEEGIADEEMADRLKSAVNTQAAKKAAEIGPENMRRVEKIVVLQTLDALWREHIVTLEHLREVVGLRGYGQRDPLNEYKTEGFTLFEGLLDRLREVVVAQLSYVELAPEGALPPGYYEDPDELDMEMHHDLESLDNAPYPDADELYGTRAPANAEEPRRQAPLRSRSASQHVDPDDPTTWGKVSRNAPCPCGSGKKYKHCHGAIGAAMPAAE